MGNPWPIKFLIDRRFGAGVRKNKSSYQKFDRPKTPMKNGQKVAKKRHGKFYKVDHHEQSPCLRDWVGDNKVIFCWLAGQGP